ncbi:unnamed protein product [Adineta steineri]|uniref:DUF1868 domain-containing protein n=1 Tax=Adineta steineri TaxID=433720 RepID=A0A818QDM1_9BILA|nr:unnamed protein product [Adineta steineri]CAF3639460.1 unnamed protein product [Adineta steineri]
MYLRRVIIRRSIICLCFITISSVIFSATRPTQSEGYISVIVSIFTFKPKPKIVAEDGSFVTNPGYEIAQFVVVPLKEKFTELFNTLDQSEIKDYFTMVPQSAYHITLAKLTNTAGNDQHNFQLLVREQQVLDARDTFTKVLAKDISIVNDNEIRVAVDFSSAFIDKVLKKAQKRWKNHFAHIIAKMHRSFYITIAYQYKPIPDRETLDRIETTLKSAQQFPFDVEIDPIEILASHDAVSFTPLLPDEQSP